MPRLAPLALIAAMAAAPALACEEDAIAESDTSYLDKGVFTYDVFELSVAHTDLSVCPDEFDPDAVFCRYAETEGAANIFVFSYEDDMPLLAIKHVPLDEGKAILEATAY